MNLTVAVYSIVLFVIYLWTGGCLGDVAKLLLALVEVGSDRVLIQWRGVDLSKIKACEMSYVASNNKGTATTYVPENYTIQIKGLSPSVHYSYYLSCRDTANVTYKSDLLNFTTTAMNSPAIVYTDASSSTPLPTSTLAISSTETPPVTEQIQRESSPIDIGLGVAFGLIGVGVFGFGGYYMLREYRRRMRIRRFLQYRQQENETFPDIDQEEDEGIVL